MSKTNNKPMKTMPTNDEIITVLKALTGSLGTFSTEIPQDEQFWTTSDSEALEAGLELLEQLK